MEREEAEYLTVDQAATVLGVGSKVIYGACHRDGLRHVKIKYSRYGKIRIKRSWLDDWILKRSQVN